ncbi:MAG: zinc-dependent metalloprotease [Proteobacteria bacterium]|nr:zinc-dependent metalloprotease [Pseudomonadota bacterium]
MHISRVSSIALITSLNLLFIGCAEDITTPDSVAGDSLGEVQAQLDKEESFVAVARSVDSETFKARQSALGVGKVAQALAGDKPRDFYLAIHKRELGKHWFLTAFLNNYIAASDVFGGYTLGTRVVSFELQNDRLYVFDVDRRKQVSDIFNPDVVIEAYPAVNSRRFRGLRGAGNYVLIDPASGLNRFSIVGDAFSGGEEQVFVEISFLRNFRSIADGITYEQIFSGYSNQSQGNSTLEPNPFRISGSLSMSVRRYAEGEGFVETPLPPSEHYFRSYARAVPNTGTFEQTALHWNVHPGMEAREWVISREVATYEQRPDIAGVDLVGAVKRGIESWNDAFGFEVFTARLAEPDEILTREDKNFFIFDPDATRGFAFAQWRSNPNSGEIRNASVYFSAAFVNPDRFSDDPEVGNAVVTPPVERSKPVRLTWGSYRDFPHCILHASDYRDVVGADVQPLLTKEEKLALYIQHIVAHEVGHTVGLRHNFKGSLKPPTSSVMEYTSSVDAIYQPSPGSYDIAAVRYSHGLDTALPSDPFCTDGDTLNDPACLRFDRGADPLYDGAIADYQLIIPFLFAVGYDGYEFYLDYYSARLRAYIIAGSSDESLIAYQELMAPVGAPIDRAILDAEPSYGVTADKIARRLFSLLLAGPSPYDAITGSITNPDIVAQLTAELEANITNVDGVRSYETRRLGVDLLKAAQTVDAYRALLSCRDRIAADLDSGTLSGDDELLTTDLLTRVNEALSPYFD